MERQSGKLQDEVLVIGAGLAGVCSAWYLRQAGYPVRVIERAAAVAEGTSFANAGMLTPSMADPWNAPGIYRQFFRMLVRQDSTMRLRWQALPSLFGWGLRFLAHSRPQAFARNMRSNLRLANYSLESLTGLEDVLDWRAERRGTMKIFRQRVDLETVYQQLRPLIQSGLAVDALDPRGLVEREPLLAPVMGNYAGGLYFPGDRSGDARAFTCQLAARCEREGVSMQLNTTVEELLVERGRVQGVRFGGEAYRCKRVVLATGPWSPALVREAGLKLPLRPVKGYSISIDTSDWQQRPRIPVIDEHLHAAITPLDNCLRVAGTAEFAAYDLGLSEARIASLFRLLAAVYPELADRLADSSGLPEWAKPWAGLRPVVYDGVPIIGATPIEGLYLNTGHGHLGWTLAAGSGRLLADLLSGSKPAIDPRPYACQRFR